MTHPPARRHEMRRSLAVLLVLTVWAALIYSNTFSSAFQFDDRTNIVDNPLIQSLTNFRDLSGPRYVGFLSFALNYHFGGFHLFGYHLINLLIHITNGVLIYCLLMLLGRSPHALPSPPPSVHTRPAPFVWMAAATALLFVVHPIQTQAVTYIVQRFASLATLFYLLTVVCYLKWRLASPDARARWLWYGGSLLSTILAMKTKEISFTLPVMLLLVEAVFFRAGPSEHRWKRWARLGPFLLTLWIIPLAHLHAAGEAGLARETAEISRWDYLLTQFRVIVTYLRLLLFPVRQNLDYDFPISHSLSSPEVWLSLLLLLSLLALSLYLLFVLAPASFACRLGAFGLLWFFLTLSIESSIIPIRDVIFEHRLYLPSAGFLLAGTAALQSARLRSWTRGTILAMIAVGILAAILSAATYQRNRVWKDERSLWTDVVAKSPRYARGHNNLGEVYREAGRTRDALDEFQAALRLNADDVVVRTNVGLANAELGRIDEAILEYQAALRRDPSYAKAHYNLGLAYAAQKNLDGAIREYQTALRLQPDYWEAANNLANIYAYQGRYEEALEEYHRALQRHPDKAELHYNAGAVARTLGRLGEARTHYEQALRLQPGFDAARRALQVLPR